MKYLWLPLLSLFVQSQCFAGELSVLSSGKDFAVGLWGNKDDSKVGYYASLTYDTKDYKNGDRVSVCRNGSISGSLGSGSCSGHGGVAHGKEAEYGRIGIGFGVSYQLKTYLDIHGGIVVDSYTSDIDIGTKDLLDFTEIGMEVGTKVRLGAASKWKLIANYQTKLKNTQLGISYSW